MKIHVRYYGMLSELVQKDTELLNLNASHLSEVIDTLQKKYPGLIEKVYKVAVNDEIIDGDIELKDNFSMDLMPPFAGG